MGDGREEKYRQGEELLKKKKGSISVDLYHDFMDSKVFGAC